MIRPITEHPSPHRRRRVHRHRQRQAGRSWSAPSTAPARPASWTCRSPSKGQPAAAPCCWWAKVRLTKAGRSADGSDDVCDAEGNLVADTRISKPWIFGACRLPSPLQPNTLKA